MTLHTKLSSSWLKGFQVAEAASLYATAPRVGLRIGAALYSKSILLSIGFNTFNVTHPEADRCIEFDRNIHAEHRAIIKRQHYGSSNLIMYVYRELFDGSTANCSPCKRCQFLMKEAGVKRVRFTQCSGFGEIVL